ncbi:MAG TPA: hypothetical protein VL156_19745 [Terriglobales bacterium]|jgi:hypothetical protein|nr:hypothetical protein [Terriglobales bacterium]
MLLHTAAAIIRVFLNLPCSERDNEGNYFKADEPVFADVVFGVDVPEALIEAIHTA